jgi:hypothetical protein
MKMKIRKTIADCSPDELEFLRILDHLSETEKSVMFRYGVRLLNNCPKARRLTDMAIAGQISRQQFFAAL